MPVVTMIAGPNGSGKSTFYREMVAQGVRFGDYFNADDIAATLDGAAVDVNRTAQQMVRDGRDEALRQRRDYCWETVMSHSSHIEHLQLARKMGYVVRLFYIGLEDPALNIRRVAERVVSGGHDVPSDRIKARYYRSINNLAAALRVSDRAWIFDNSSFDSHFDEIAVINSDRMLVLRKDWFSTPRWFIPALISLKATN